MIGGSGGNAMQLSFALVWTVDSNRGRDLQSHRNLMLSFIVSLLRCVGEQGNISAEVSHSTAQARLYSQ